MGSQILEFAGRDVDKSGKNEGKRQRPALSASAAAFKGVIVGTDRRKEWQWSVHLVYMKERSGDRARTERVTSPTRLEELGRKEVRLARISTENKKDAKSR